MPVTAVTTDPEALTMTLIGDFAAPVERLWRAAGPRSVGKPPRLHVYSCRSSKSCTGSKYCASNSRAKRLHILLLRLVD